MLWLVLASLLQPLASLLYKSSLPVDVVAGLGVLLDLQDFLNPTKSWTQKKNHEASCLHDSVSMKGLPVLEADLQILANDISLLRRVSKATTVCWASWGDERLYKYRTWEPKANVGAQLLTNQSKKAHQSR